jgi:ubiquinone/menaquinone biosynthesis C-methylase UbiE
MASRAQRSGSFGAVAEDYDRLRPGPVEEALDWLIPAGAQTVVDVAAGTGLLTRALAARVPEVIAVEPDDRMRAVLSERSPQLRALAGYGESIPLPDACADGVFVSSAWHWMDEARAVPEIARVLRPGGRLGVIWTSRDWEMDWVRALDQPWASQRGIGRQRVGHHDVILPDDGSFRDVSTASFRGSREMTIEDLIALLGTYSGAITASESKRRDALDRARDVLERQFPGQVVVDVPIRSDCWRADRL